MAVDSGYAEGVTLGAGLYTGYAYVGGLEDSKMVAMGFANLAHPEHLADARNLRRGVLWLDVLDEFVMDDARRIAMVETKTVDADVPGTLVIVPRTRYQFDNHLGTATLELDETGLVISYEEYHPYGTTAYFVGPGGISAQLI